MREIFFTMAVTVACAVSVVALNCEVAENHFRARNFTFAGTCKEQSVDGICGNSSTCCSLALQGEMRQKVPLEIRERLSFISDYRRELSQIETVHLEAYRNLFIQSQKQTLMTLNNDLRFSNHNESVEAFYNRLKSYLLGNSQRHPDEDNPSIVSIALDNLFSEIFVSVYEQTANPRTKSFSEAFKDCLRKQNAALQPFGVAPQRLSSYFSRSFHVGHLVVKSTKLLTEVLGTAADINASSFPECSRAFGNLVHCPACQGVPDLAPCNRFCVNVVRGCLAPLSDLNTPWKSQVEKTIRLLKKAQETNYHVELGLMLISRRIIESVQYAMDNGIEVVKRVRMSCGDPEGGDNLLIKKANDSSHRRLRRTAQPEEVMDLLTEPARKLQESSETLQGKLHTILDLFETITDRLCPDVINVDCWNGSAKGDYSKVIVGRGVSAQRLNPEMTFNDSVTASSEVFVKHSLRMKQVAGALSQAVVFKAKPGIENYQVEPKQKEAFVSDGSGDFGTGSGEDEGSGSGFNQPDVDAEPDIAPEVEKRQNLTSTVITSPQNTESANKSPARLVIASHPVALGLLSITNLILSSLRFHNFT